MSFHAQTKSFSAKEVAMNAKTFPPTDLPEDERLYSIPHAFERVSGRRPSPATCTRWHTRGIRGVRLKTVLFGGRRMCSVAAAREFLEATTDAADGASVPRTEVRTSRNRDASLDRKDQELRELGA
jgi:hypothetical protein